MSAAHVLRESAKQHRLAGDPAHAALCDRAADDLETDSRAMASALLSLIELAERPSAFAAWSGERIYAAREQVKAARAVLGKAKS